MLEGKRRKEERRETENEEKRGRRKNEEKEKEENNKEDKRRRQKRKQKEKNVLPCTDKVGKNYESKTTYEATGRKRSSSGRKTIISLLSSMFSKKKEKEQTKH